MRQEFATDSAAALEAINAPGKKQVIIDGNKTIVLTGADIKEVVSDPIRVSPRRFLWALTDSGLRPAVEAAIAASPQKIKDWYATADYFERDNPVIIQLATQLGKTAEDLDALFALAESYA